MTTATKITRSSSLPLSSVATFIRGITFKPEELIEGDTEGAVACMRTKNVQVDLDESDILYVPKHLVKREEQFLQPNDMLVSTANSWELVGKSSWVPTLNYRATAGGFISILRANHTKVVPRYLFHWFTSPVIQSRVRHCGRKTTNISNLSYEQCLSIEIPIPPLPEQRRIADILDKADAIRRKRQEEMNLANAIRRSVFLESFGDPDVNEKRLPLVKFSSVWIDGLRNGISPSSRGKHQGKVLVLSAITGSAFNHDAVKEGTFDKPFDGGQLVKSDEFLICRGNGNLNLVGAGRFPIISLNDTVFPDTMIAARLNREVIEPAYLEEIWSSRSVRAQLERSARTTNGTYKVNQQVLAEITFPLTPLTAQRKYASIVTAIKELIHLYGTSPTDDLFNSLVQRAFRGEL